MNKTEMKAFDKLIENAADDICGKFFDAAISITDEVYLELLKRIRDKTNVLIYNAEKRSEICN